MISDFLDLHKFLRNEQIEFNKNGLKEIVLNYKFYYISEMRSLIEYEKQIIIQNLKYSKVLIISQLEYNDERKSQKYLLIGFEKILMIFDYSSISLLYDLLAMNQDLSVYFISNNSIHKKMSEKNDEISTIYDNLKNNCEVNEADDVFLEEIKSLSSSFYLLKRMIHIKPIWRLIVPIISAYLIQKSYLSLKKNRLEHFILDYDNVSNKNSMKKEDFVELRTVGIGSISQCILIFNIKRCELYALKNGCLINFE